MNNIPLQRRGKFRKIAEKNNSNPLNSSPHQAMSYAGERSLSQDQCGEAVRAAQESLKGDFLFEYNIIIANLKKKDLVCLVDTRIFQRNFVTHT